ncbi:MAG: outer membrane lipoprotein-sorting protein [Thermodesulfobacteriota bacterium]
MKKSKPVIFLAAVLFCLSAFPAAAEEITGKILAQKIFDRDRGRNSAATAQMVLISKSGSKRVRTFTNKRFMEDGLERQLIRFTSPADIEGTGFLTIEKEGWKTEQFLYLPALRRTRRIVTSQQSQRFVNSDFTYEDMKRHPVDNYTYEITGSRKVGNLECYALEARPKKNTDSQYGLTRSLVSKKCLVPVVVEYFDQKCSHFKTYKTLQLEKVQGIWTEMTVSMEDFEREHKTFIKVEQIDYNTDIDKDLVSRKSLADY